MRDSCCEKQRCGRLVIGAITESDTRKARCRNRLPIRVIDAADESAARRVVAIDYTIARITDEQSAAERTEARWRKRNSPGSIQRAPDCDQMPLQNPVSIEHVDETEDLAGRGRGFVDVFDTDGHLLRRFASRGSLNSPWGITRASFAFGRFSGRILIGNFGDGRIDAFDDDGRFIDELDDAHGKPLVIDGLWTLTLGGGRGSSSDTLYFTAGPDGESNGLFGSIVPAHQ